MLNVDNNDETPAARRQQGECVNAATCTLPADIMASSITAIIVMLAVIRPSVMEAEASRKNGVIVSSSVWHRRERGRRSSSYIHTHVGTHSAHVRTHDKSQPHNFEEKVLMIHNGTILCLPLACVLSLASCFLPRYI